MSRENPLWGAPRVWPFFDVDSFVAQFDKANRALIVEGLHKAGLK
jgi:hypothetical protein